MTTFLEPRKIIVHTKDFSICQCFISDKKVSRVIQLLCLCITALKNCFITYEANKAMTYLSNLNMKLREMSFHLDKHNKK